MSVETRKPDDGDATKASPRRADDVSAELP